jgi:hypothetical protein
MTKPRRAIHRRSRTSFEYRSIEFNTRAPPKECNHRRERCERPSVHLALQTEQECVKAVAIIALVIPLTISPSMRPGPAIHEYKEDCSRFLPEPNVCNAQSVPRPRVHGEAVDFELRVGAQAHERFSSNGSIRTVQSLVGEHLPPGRCRVTSYIHSLASGCETNCWMSCLRRPESVKFGEFCRPDHRKRIFLRR